MSGRLRKIEASAILPPAGYAKVRAERRRAITDYKKNRRLEVGPHAAFYFESYETMLHQVHEMLFIEKGGPAQVPEELAAYNPLIPQGSELVATVMFEIDDPARRARVLGALQKAHQVAPAFSVSHRGNTLTLNGTSHQLPVSGITVSAGNALTLNGAWSNPGVLTLNGGTLNLDGTFTQQRGAVDGLSVTRVSNRTEHDRRKLLGPFHIQPRHRLAATRANLTRQLARFFPDRESRGAF